MTVWARQSLFIVGQHSGRLLQIFLFGIATIAALLFVSTPIQAVTQNYKTINFSARLKNSDGTAIPDGLYNVQFRLYNAGQSGASVWSETYYDTNGAADGGDHRVNVVGGYLNVQLGSRTAFDSKVNWNDQLWLTMNIGGTEQASAIESIPWDGEMSPRIQLTAVPYAMNAGALEGKAAGDFVQLGQGVQTNSSDNPSIHINTTGSGNLVQLQRDAEDVFTVDNSGNIAFGGGSNHTIAIAQSQPGIDGQTLTISGGDGGEGTTNGGNLVLTGGSGSGDGADGLVVLTTATFATAVDDSNCYPGGTLALSNCTVSQATVDSSSAAMVGFSAEGQTATLPDPSITTAGRIFYVMAANDSLPFILRINDTEFIAMKPKSAQTLLWNGSDWVIAGNTGTTGSGVPQESAIDPQTIIEPSEEAATPLVVEEGEVSETDPPISIEDTTPPTNQSPTDQSPDAESTDTPVPGSMYYDVDLGKVQCYEANGWGPCGDAPDTFVTISPEYSNAVMNGTDIGVISSDFCSGSLGINDGSEDQPAICNPTDTYNFYQWTSQEKEAQTRSIYLTYKLPDNFKSFVGDSTAIMGRTDNDDADVSYQLYRDNGAGLETCGEPIAISHGDQPEWQKGEAVNTSDPANCGFEAGDSILFRINLTAQNGANAYVSNVSFIFRNN